MVETQLCKLRGTSDTFVGRAYSIFHLQYVFCELNLRYDDYTRYLDGYTGGTYIGMYDTRYILLLYVEYSSHNWHPRIHTQGFIVMYGLGRLGFLIV